MKPKNRIRDLLSHYADKYPAFAAVVDEGLISYHIAPARPAAPQPGSDASKRRPDFFELRWTCEKLAASGGLANSELIKRWLTDVEQSPDEIRLGGVVYKIAPWSVYAGLKCYAVGKDDRRYMVAAPNAGRVYTMLARHVRPEDLERPEIGSVRLTGQRIPFSMVPEHIRRHILDAMSKAPNHATAPKAQTNDEQEEW